MDAVTLAQRPPVAVQPDRPPPASARLAAIDLLRGAVVALMVLDHVRSFLGPHVNPEDLATAGTALFLTRWVTHFCAPVFVFAAGSVISNPDSTGSGGWRTVQGPAVGPSQRESLLAPEG